jgi:histidine ammonia-lyase
VRAHVPRLTRDRPLAPDFEKLAAALRRGEFDF